eukprot:GFKZ01008516.1.p1 GENE.GFKZ01008516.1~~GFKZ01008516.1.p1  ORF type:complete len:494 (+),score=74.78 GFKZ01008516.1:278-1759(+)
MGKYAVVIGVNYTKNPEAALEGCCNDARIMRGLLESKGFEEENIKLIVDDDDDYESPNHINVKNALNWLCTGREPGDIIFMHFSGHGTQVPADDDDEEDDALDEAICLEELFLMADDDLKQFFSQLPEGVRATVVMDCCHSGSMLDGTEVAIEGAKDGDSAAPHQESDELLSVLGGSREVEHVNRSLPLSTIAQVMSGQLGQTVEPTGSGVNGAMAQMFGGNAGKLMTKFALAQLSKSDGGETNPMLSMLGNMLGGGTKPSGGNPLSALLGGGSTTQTSSNPLSSLLGGGSTTQQSSNPLGSLLGGGGSTQEASNPLGSLLGGGGSTQQSSNPLGSMFGGGGNSSNSNPLGGLMGMMGGSSAPEPVPEPAPAPAPTQSQDPMGMLTGMLGGMGLSQASSDAPAYNPTHEGISRDVCTLITGCQANETSADVRPAGGDAYGALTKTLTDVYQGNPEINYYDLVSGVRSKLSQGGFKQNPCLECSEESSKLPFIC